MPKYLNRQIAERSAFSLLLFFMGSVAVHGQATSYEPFQDVYRGNDAHFSHWSSRTEGEGGGATLKYAICNHDSDEALIYQWPEPRIASGPRGAIPPFRCHAISRTAAFAEDTEGSILFTQAGFTHGASAYVSIPDQIADWPRVIRSTAQVFFFREGYEQPSLADLTIIEASTGEGVFYHINFGLEPAVQILYGVDHMDEEAISRFIEFANENRYDATLTVPAEVLTEESLSYIDEGRINAPVLSITRREDSGRPLQFRTVQEVFGSAENFINIIDAQGNLIVDAAIASILSRPPR